MPFGQKTFDRQTIRSIENNKKGPHERLPTLVGKTEVDQMSFSQMTIGRMPVSQIYFIQMSFSQMTIGRMPVSQIYFVQMSFCQMSFSQTFYIQMYIGQMSFSQMSSSQMSFKEISFS